MKHLCVEISEDFCALTEISANEIFSKGRINFTGKKDFQLKEQLADFVKDKINDLSSYDEVSVSWISSRALLVPSSIFEPKEISTLFSVCFTNQLAATELDYNRLSELSIVNIYEVPLWLKSFFVIRFPRVIIQHEYSMNLRGMMKNAFKLAIHVQVYGQLMTIQLVGKNEVLYCNSFEVQHANDILYYLAFVLQQLQLTEQEGVLNFYTENSTVFTKEELLGNINKIGTFKHLSIDFNADKIIKFHQFCV